MDTFVNRSELFPSFSVYGCRACADPTTVKFQVQKGKLFFRSELFAFLILSVLGFKLSLLTGLTVRKIQ